MAARRIPIFHGYDPTSWFFEAERVFVFGRYSDGEKLLMAEESMAGDALLWFRWEDGRQPFRTWRELKLAMLNRFRIPVEQATHYQPSTDEWDDI